MKGLNLSNISCMREHYLFSNSNNNYVASVVQTNYNIGYELAILDSNGDLCYSTSITNDVMKNLTLKQVEETLIKISLLTN
jgi:hypothetical protein